MLTGRKAILHGCVKVEEAHRQHTGTIANLTGHHASAAKANIGAQYFAFYGRKNAGEKIVDSVQTGAVFIAQR